MSNQTILSNDDAAERLRDKFNEICEDFTDDPETAASWWTEITGFPARSDNHFVQVTAKPEYVGLFLQQYLEGTLQSDNSECLASLWQTVFGTEVKPVCGLTLDYEEPDE